MKVLLISPLRGLDPACGDIVYTETLLALPPDGVQYETYAQAIERGSLREHGTRRALTTARNNGRGITAELLRLAFSKPINLLRGRRWLFLEPFRCFSVRENEYDLIHVHVFSANFVNLPCPLVVSNAAPVRSLYLDARGYARWRVKILEMAERILGRIGKVNVVSYRLPQATRVIAFTDYLRHWYLDQKIVPADRVEVVPIYLPVQKNVRFGGDAARVPMRIGFVAKDFNSKGGPTLLRAYERVRLTRPDAELVIVGSGPQLSDADLVERGIRWFSYVPRELLLSEIFPSFDVFAYPTEFDGMPLVVLEALSLGIPVVTSDYQAMPELVNRGQAGRVSTRGDAAALAADIIALLEPSENRRMREVSLAWFAQTFSAGSVRPRLLSVYEKAITEFKGADARMVAAC